MVTTELPSRVCNGIVEGRVALIVDGNPFALTLPITFLDMFYTADDDILRTPYKLITKLIRIVAIFITVIVPSLYLGVVNYHPDVLPIGILNTIIKAKESIPFPFFIEILVMEIMFEIVQESRLRIPSQLGSVIGIVGSLILGQAAVTAKIISPITIIVVSLSIISSLAIPGYYFSFGFKILKYMFILLSEAFGLLGIVTGVYGLICYIIDANSFGYSFVPDFYVNKDDNILKRIFVKNIKEKKLIPYYIKNKN